MSRLEWDGKRKLTDTDRLDALTEWHSGRKAGENGDECVHEVLCATGEDVRAAIDRRIRRQHFGSAR